jgi:IclR family acetate operon transcriptional repressor
LRDKTHETVNLMILQDGMGVYIDRVESPQRLRMVSFVGTREELHCTAVGKALLAFLSEPEVDKIIEKHGLAQKTPKTITNPGQLKQHLSQIRKMGYSIDDEEAEIGVRCIGAPIFNYKNKIEASISVSAPSYRLEKQKLKEVASLVKEIAEEISLSIGKVTKNKQLED